MEEPSAKARERLRHIRREMENIRAFTRGMSGKEFKTDIKTFRAVVKSLDIISEATKTLPAEFKERHPEIDWKGYRRFGDLSRHVYEKVREEEIWKIVRRRFRPLEELAQKISGK